MNSNDSSREVVTLRDLRYFATRHLKGRQTIELEDYQQADVDTLASLYAAHDPRGLEQMIAEDKYEDVTAEKVTRGKGNGYEVGFDGSLCTFFTMPEGKTIRVGDTIRLFLTGPVFGGRRHGFAVNGEVIEYETPWDRFAERMAMLARHDHERRERFAKEKVDIDRWYALLRSPYSDRIDRFRAKKADFDLNGGSYEVYPVLMAQRIEDWCREQTETPEGDFTDEQALHIVKQFRELPHDEQEPVIHGGEDDTYGISGHQFDSACGLARAVLSGETV
jgi:hypothetical protein